MLSSFQNSVSFLLRKELRRNQQRFTRLKIQLHEEYMPLIYMFLTICLLQIIPNIILAISLYNNFKLTMFLGIVYYSWIRYDSRTLHNEGRRSYWFKYLPIFNVMRDYFPLRLIKTAELPAGRPYLLGIFPHGVVTFGAIFNFSTNINKFPELFPGHDIRGVILDTAFYLPVVREFLMALGSCTSNEQNIKNLLQSSSPKMVGLCPGGVKELSMSHPGSKYTIVKENRKGFIRIALETGSSLVPVFSFGEQNAFDQSPLSHPIFKFFGDQFYKITRAKLVLPIGRGFFQKKFGFLPQRCPITSVVGKPIPVPKEENPSSALIDEYHERFYEALRNLFEENKHLYDEFGDEATLEMI